MTAFVLAHLAVVAAVDTTCVANGSFERGGDGSVAGWNLPVKWSFAAGEGINGTDALCCKNDDKNWYAFPSQSIALECGRGYRFSVMVRTEDVKGPGATLCLEWADEKGRYLGGQYVSHVKGTKDWTKIGGSISSVPAGAHSFRISPYMDRFSTGKAWFDDLTVVPLAQRFVRAVCSSAYRNMATDGDVAFRAIMEDSSNVPFERVVFRYEDISGKACESVADADYAVTLPVSALKQGRQTVVAEARGKDGSAIGSATVSFTRKTALQKRAVMFDAQRRTIVDGKPFFPLGMYFNNVRTNELETYAQGPFNCLLPYASPMSVATMDAIHARGLKVIYSVKDCFAGARYAPKEIKTVADEVPYLKNIVSRFKGHPALLAWYLNDESPLSMLPRLEGRRALMERLDPGHPGYAVLYQVDDVAEYLHAFDVIGTDPYPIPARPASLAASWTRTTVRASAGCKPVWMVPQAFDWAAYPGQRGKPRPPTETELRSMCWQCIACGANGLVLYSWFDLKKEPSGVSFEKRWAECCRVGAEIRAFESVLLADTASGFAHATTSQKGDALCVRAWRKDGKIWILAVNVSEKPIDAKLALAERCAAAAAAFGPSPRLSSGERAFSLALEPLEPALVKIDLLQRTSTKTATVLNGGPQ